jgi:putative transposase
MAVRADADHARHAYARSVARRPRLLLPPVAAFHVTSRGVARQAISRDDDDRSLFVSLLRLAARRWRWNLLAYCLMPNHFHLVVTSELERLSRGMHLLNFRYAQSFNERHDRVGHLYQGRFSTYVVETDEHFVAACAYVFENPVRAGLCATRDEWPWIGGEVLTDLR